MLSSYCSHERPGFDHTGVVRRLARSSIHPLSCILGINRSMTSTNGVGSCLGHRDGVVIIFAKRTQKVYSVFLEGNGRLANLTCHGRIEERSRCFDYNCSFVICGLGLPAVLWSVLACEEHTGYFFQG